MKEIKIEDRQSAGSLEEEYKKVDEVVAGGGSLHLADCALATILSEIERIEGGKLSTRDQEILDRTKTDSTTLRNVVRQGLKNVEKEWGWLAA